MEGCVVESHLGIHFCPGPDHIDTSTEKESRAHVETPTLSRLKAKVVCCIHCKGTKQTL